MKRKPGRPLKHKGRGRLYFVMSLRIPPNDLEILWGVSDAKELALSDLVRKVIFDYVDKHPDCVAFRKGVRKPTKRRL